MQASRGWCVVQIEQHFLEVGSPISLTFLWHGCQGMSDLLSPILYVIEDESEAFWCFAALMERMAPNFHRDQNGMHSQLMALSKVNETSLLAVRLKLFLRVLYHFMVVCFYVVILSISSWFFPLLVPVSTCANPLCRAMFACKEAATSDTPGLLVQLVQLLDNPLHDYFKQNECLNYFFCFRWILIQFKRWELKNSFAPNSHYCSHYPFDWKFQNTVNIFFCWASCFVTLWLFADSCTMWVQSCFQRIWLWQHIEIVGSPVEQLSFRAFPSLHVCRIAEAEPSQNHGRTDGVWYTAQVHQRTQWTHWFGLHSTGCRSIVFVCRRKGGSLYRSWNSSCTCGYRSWNLNHNLKKVVCFPFPCHFFYCMQQPLISVQRCRSSCQPIISVQLGWSANDRLLHLLFHQRIDDRLFWMIGCNQVRLMYSRNLLSGRFCILIDLRLSSQQKSWGYGMIV